MTNLRSKLNSLLETLKFAEGLVKGSEPDMASPDEPKGLKNKRKPVTHDECGRPFAKDETGDKIKAKLKAEMDKRGFGEADAIRHKIDVERGEARSSRRSKRLDDGVRCVRPGG